MRARLNLSAKSATARIHWRAQPGGSTTLRGAVVLYEAREYYCTCPSVRPHFHRLPLSGRGRARHAATCRCLRQLLPTFAHFRQRSPTFAETSAETAIFSSFFAETSTFRLFSLQKLRNVGQGAASRRARGGVATKK